MNTFCILFDAGTAAFLWLIGLFFCRKKGEAAIFISGDVPDNFDKDKLCKTYGKRFMISALPFAAGLVLDIFVSPVGCIVAWAVWLVMFAWHMYDIIVHKDKYIKNGNCKNKD